VAIGTKEIAVASVLGALAFLSEVIVGPPFDIPFPFYQRVTWDVTGIPIMISLLLYGPMTGVYTCLIGCAIIFLRGNVPGGIFKVVAELSTILAYAAVRGHLVTKSAVTTVSRVLVMTVTNYYLLQYFYNMPETVVVGLLPVLAIFNATQALINILPAHVIHRRLPLSIPQ
jgi:riboflavin transporter FmnP